MLWANFAGHFPIRTTENGTPKIYSKLHKICSICPLSPQIMQNSCNLHQFPKVLCVPMSKIAKISGNLRFGQITQISPAIFSDSDHGKWNSQNLQQIAQNLLNLPTVTANHAKFAQFASISQGSLYPRVELSNFAIFVNLCNFVDLSF